MNERRAELLEVELVALRELDRRRAGFERRHSLGDCARGRQHEPALVENRERARSLADEVRGRLEAGVRVHATTRQECNVRRLDVPADRLCGVPGVLVLGKQDQKRPTEGLEERCEHERQRGLGDARIGRQRIDECAKPFAGGKLDDEWAERRRVHAGGGTRSREAIVTAADLLPGARLPRSERVERRRSLLAVARPPPHTPRGTPVPLQTP